MVYKLDLILSPLGRMVYKPELVLPLSYGLQAGLDSLSLGMVFKPELVLPLRYGLQAGLDSVDTTKVILLRYGLQAGLSLLLMNGFKKRKFSYLIKVHIYVLQAELDPLTRREWCIFLKM